VDDREFAELTKALADGQSRRRIVKILGAGVLSGLAGLVGRGDTEARKRKRGANAQAVPTTTKKPTTTTKKPTTTTKKPTTTTKKPTTTTKRPPKVCFHSARNGCKPTCTSAGFTGRQCNVICGNGQITGACPVGQGGDNPCCNAGYCVRSNYVADDNGNPVYIGPTSGC
jgi:hypothetical protein